MHTGESKNTLEKIGRLNSLYETSTETQTNIVTRINTFSAIVLCSRPNFFKVMLGHLWTNPYEFHEMRCLYLIQSCPHQLKVVCSTKKNWKN